MHDEWFDPMAAETRAFFRLAREEAPDFVVSLHSHASRPSIEPTAYVPRTVKEIIQRIGDRVQRRYAERGPAAPQRRARSPPEDGETSRPPRSTSAAPCTTPAAAVVVRLRVLHGDAGRPPIRQPPTTRSSTCN